MPAVAFVYLLHCADGSLYCGWTVDLEKRLAAHNAGTASRYTSRRLPVRYAGAWEVADRSTALRAEYAIKQLARPDKDRLLRGMAVPERLAPLLGSAAIRPPGSPPS
jgi:putative endonuclease